MKTAAAFAIASLTLTALTGVALAQSGTAAPAPAAKPAAPATTGTPAATPAAKPAETAKPAPKMKHVVGDVVSVDTTAKTLTLKHTVNGKSEEMTLGSGEKTAEVLGTLKAGDHVQVAYAEMDGKPVASTIAKVKK
jgi:Cu/Ag efflux protein CusF